MTGPAATAEPAEIVVRPDLPRYRRYFALRWTVVLLIVGALVVWAVVADRTEQTRIGLVFGGLLFGAVAVTVLRWRHRTYLDPEPALVLGPDQFRILHKGLHLWVPWIDVASVRVITLFRGHHVIELLEFDLRPEARWKLPPEPASMVDWMMTWRTDDLIYFRPCDSPRMEEVEQIAQRLHEQATGGHRLRAEQRAHWPKDLREGRS